MTNKPKTVYLWLLSQSVNNDYDAYSSAVVAAHSEAEARLIHPSGGEARTALLQAMFACGDWVRPDLVNVQRIGIADEGVAAGTVVCASFNAG